MRYWLVGATWDQHDKSQEFIEHGYWENGWDEKFIDVVREVKVGDFIAIKSKFIQKNNLPFNNYQKPVSVLRIKCVGKITKQSTDGKKLDVEWKKNYAEKDFYGVGYFKTIEEVKSPQLAKWIFEEKSQDNFKELEEKYKKEDCSFISSLFEENNSKLFALPILQYLTDNPERFVSRTEIEEYLLGKYRLYKQYANKARLAINQFSQMLTHKGWKEQSLTKFVCWIDEKGELINEQGEVSKSDLESGIMKSDYQIIDDHVETLAECLSNIDFKEVDKKINSFLESFLLEKNELEQESYMQNHINQILYGPPGTGKTYHTIDKALEIIDGQVPEDRVEAKKRFDELKASGQIEFVTFHQSYGYEEFVEGIKAKTTEDENITYEVMSGIFKTLAAQAKKNQVAAYTGSRKKDFDEVFKEFIVNNVSDNERLEITMTRSRFYIREITERTIRFDKENGESEHSLSINTLREIYNAGKNEKIIGGLQPYYEAVLKYLNQNSKASSEEKKNYILIIDEINRGNISKIFGELITLIEPSKRIGAEEETVVTLPYSGEPFGVPKNLYIIGTMNTADRSIALMDTALRRRFEFVEMMPNPCLLHDDSDEEQMGCSVREWEDISRWNFSKRENDWYFHADYPAVDRKPWRGDMLIEGINLRRLLHVINERIEYLYDRDHQIGHTYLMNVRSMQDLGNAMRNKIIPLLQEYFYDDWEKIRLIFNNNGFIQVKESKNLFRDELMNDVDMEKQVYILDDTALSHPEKYQTIYE